MKLRFLAAAAALLIILPGCGQRDTLRTKDLFAMDTYMTLKAYGSDAETAIQAAELRIRALETALSVTDTASELWAINHADGQPVTVSADTRSILQTAADTAAESGGALAVSLYPVLRAWGFTTGTYQIPDAQTLHDLLQNVDDTRIAVSGDQVCLPAEMQIDFGALAKGYTGDAVIAVLREHGVSSAIISLGGNVQALGSKPDGSGWTVGIADPFSPDSNLGAVTVTDQAVVTSGNYERFFVGADGKRYWHILDPADGYPADHGLASVTVIGGSGVRCDALSTALFVEGTEGAAEHYRRCDDFEMICVTDTGALLVTEGIAAQFHPAGGREVTVIAHDET